MLFSVWGIVSNQSLGNTHYTMALSSDFVVWLLSLMMVISYEFRLAGIGWSRLIEWINFNFLPYTFALSYALDTT
jgi:hypothetical protein